MITLTAAKFVYKQLAQESDQSKSAIQIVEDNDLWLADEWTHVGYCIIICLENQKLVQSYNKGNTKVLDALLGKVIKLSNMTVDAELVKELLPLIIKVHFHA